MQITSDLELKITNNIHDDIGNDLNSFLEKNKRIYLEANPSYGKTYHFAQLGKEIKSGNSIYNRLLFCTPRLIIQEQIANDLDVDYVLNGNSDLNKLTDRHKIITSTFNSLHLISDRITNKDLIIVDEAHELLRNFNSRYNVALNPYYDKTLQTLYNNNCFLVLMSGTPTDTFHELLGLKHIKIIKNKEVKTIVNITYSGLKTKEVAYRYCEHFSKQFAKNCLNVIYIKNKKDCGEIAVYLNEKGFNAKALTSDNKSEDVYLKIAENSIIPDKIQFIITTNVISVGTNILNTNIGGIVMINENDPMEIKQFSKRFRNAKNLTIDVSNRFSNTASLSENHIKKCHSTNRKITFLQLNAQHKLLKTISNDDLEQFVDMSFEKQSLGTPFSVINNTLTKFLANESNLHDELVKTYSTPDKLKVALQNYNDIIPNLSSTNSKLFKDLKESKSKEAKKVFTDKIESILDDFIANPSTYVFYSLEILGTSNLEKNEKFKQHLKDYIDFSTLNMDASIFKDNNSALFKAGIVDPILEYIPYFNNLISCLKFIKSTIPEHRKKHILSLYVNDLIKEHCDMNESNQLIYKTDSNILQSVNRNKKLLLDIVKEVFFYLTSNRYVHTRDLRNHLNNNRRIQGIIKNSDKNTFTFNMLTTNRLNTNFILGIVYGIFVMDTKTGRFKDKNGTQKRCYLFEQNTSKFPNCKTLKLEIPYKKSKLSKEFSVEKSIRIISTSDIINSKFL